MSNIRHVIIIRKDLNFSSGLVAAQAAHISDLFMRSKILDKKKFSAIELEWMQEPYITVLAVQCREELDVIAKEASAHGLSVQHWYDTVVSPVLERKIEGVFVGISIGPDDSDKLSVVTGNLPLY